MWHDREARSALSIVVRVLSDLISWCGLALRPRRSLEAEILFLRRQLALYVERGVKPRRIDTATRLSLAFLSRWFAWRSALVVVRPETLIRLGLRVSPRTVRKYLPPPPPGRPRGDQRWSTFLQNHARAIVACDFFVAVTSTFRVLYVFIVIEHHSRRLIHCNVTAHPSAQWTRQQLREALGYETRYEYLIHDRDCIFSADLDESVKRLGLRVLKSPARSPTANAICERVIGTIRRECLDWLIPLSEAHLRQALKAWMRHYNGGRPHMALGPGIPDPPQNLEQPLPKLRHRIRDWGSVHSTAILGGLHHEYSLAPA
jgi:transposase InsO family protein